MALTAGIRLGPYEIIAALGAGGMGEVYRARDTKLNRDVAIKILPDGFAHDPERLARFRREAHVLASLNHPHIAQIHGLEDAQGMSALVMELVEGPTLADRIALGALPLDEALAIARQIAEALEAAHELGIIHRDLKPANIKVRDDGIVKVLDFGLAKALDPAASGVEAAALTQSPTITSPAAMTQRGVILGTAAYMAPEQARGKAVDKRADIWAFGCVLFEMLTGQRAFPGEDVSDTLAAVLRGEPDWSLLPELPPTVNVYLHRCLRKNPRERIQDIGDIRLALEGVFDVPVVATARASTSWWAGGVGALSALAVVAAAAAIAIATGAATGWLRPNTASPPKVSFDITMETAPSPLNLSLSPDGTRFATPVLTPQGDALWLRRLDEVAGQTLPGSVGARFPFWSPDSQSIAFFNNVSGKLTRIDLSGGPARPLCDAPTGRGGTWNSDGVILYAPSSEGPLFRVLAGGGDPVRVTELDPARGDTAHRHPKFLPDGNHFVFFVVSGQQANTGLYLGALDSKATTHLVASDAMGVFAPPDHLLFMRSTTLMAQRFDPRRLELEGNPFPVLQDIGINTQNSASGVAVSDNGVLAYRVGDSGADRILRWVDRNGSTLGEVGAVGSHANVTLAPDGERLAETRFDASGLTADIWIVDLLRGSTSRFTSDPAIDDNGIWSPDGSQMVFSSARDGGVRSLYIKRTQGGGQETRLLKTGASTYPTDWSRDGQYILYTEEKGGNDVWVLPLSGDKKPIPFLQTPTNETRARFSPDGRWIAYTSFESGQGEVYVQSFPPSDGIWKISTAGGIEPHWRGDGRELFYAFNNAIWVMS